MSLWLSSSNCSAGKAMESTWNSGVSITDRARWLNLLPWWWKCQAYTLGWVLEAWQECYPCTYIYLWIGQLNVFPRGSANTSGSVCRTCVFVIVSSSSSSGKLCIVCLGVPGGPSRDGFWGAVMVWIWILLESWRRHGLIFYSWRRSQSRSFNLNWWYRFGHRCSVHGAGS